MRVQRDDSFTGKNKFEEYFKSPNKPFVSNGFHKKFVSFVNECDAEYLEKYMRAIYNYANNVGGKKIDVKVVNTGCPHVYLLCAFVEVPYDAPCVDCFDKCLVEFVEG